MASMRGSSSIFYTCKLSKYSIVQIVQRPAAREAVVSWHQGLEETSMTEIRFF